MSLSILYQVAQALCYLCLWITIRDVFRALSPAPVQIFWQVFLILLAGSILSFLALQIQGDFLDPNVPAAPIVHVKSALFSTIIAGMSFMVVQQFGFLVRFRRTRQSERNWFLMMMFVGLTYVVSSPLHHQYQRIEAISNLENLLLLLVILSVVILMFLNTIRLGWIVRISAKQKVAAICLGIFIIGLTGGFLLFLFRGDADTSLITGLSSPIDYLRFYSISFALVIVQLIAFGFIYSLTSVLSLLFHLPTIGDYRKKIDEMAAMQALTVLGREVANSEKLYQWVVSTSVESGRGKAAWLTIQDLDSGSLKPQIIAAHAIETIHAEESCDVAAIHSEAEKTRIPVLIQDTISDRRILKSKAHGIASLLAIPLVTRTEVLGTLFVSRDIAYSFENDDIESIGVFASQATLMLENARLFEAKIERERLASELAIARDVQHRLLPQKMPLLPNLSLAASSTPALEVGGDYYDLLKLSDETLAFFVADVSGKGTSAAFYMAELQGIFHSVTQIAPDPKDFLYHVDLAMGRLLGKNIFVTAIYGLLDCSSGTVSIARAGHSPPVLAHANGDTELLRSDGIGIGLDQRNLFIETLSVEKFVFNPGDLIVLYTDGIIECRNPEGEEFGYDRLSQCIQSARYDPAQDVHDAVLETIDRFVGPDKKYDDDLTLLVLKWHGEAS